MKELNKWDDSPVYGQFPEDISPIDKSAKDSSWNGRYSERIVTR